MSSVAPNDTTAGAQSYVVPTSGDVPFRVERIDHVVLRCKNMQTMVEFYCGTLGLEVAKRNERLGLVHLRAGSAMLDLVPVKSFAGDTSSTATPVDSRNMDHFCLRIEPFDFAALESYLRTKSVNPGELRMRFGAEGDGASFYITDPEGNRVELKGPSGV